MNKSLYEEITSRLNSLSDEQKEPNNLRNLMGQWSNRGNYTDSASVLCAFYNFMDGKEKYSFIHSVPDWSRYFSERFSNHFTIDVIKTDFDNIIYDDKIVDIILKFTPESVQKEFYTYACEVNSLGKENGINVYEEALNKLEDKLVAKGLIDKPVVTEPIKTSENAEQNIQVDALSEAGIDVNLDDLENLHVGLDDIVTDSIGSQQVAGTTIDTVVEPVSVETFNTPIKPAVTPIEVDFTPVEEKPAVAVETPVQKPKITVRVAEHQVKKPRITARVVEPTTSVSENITEPVELENTQPKTASQMSDEIRNLQAQQAAQRDTTFSSAASNLGVASSDLIKKVGEEASLDVDNIVVDDAVVQMVAERQEKVASVSNGTLRRIKERSNKRKNLRRMGIEVVNDGNIQTVKVVKQDTVFDKIATTGRNVLDRIKNGIKIASGITLTTAALGIFEPEVLMEAIKNKKLKDFDLSSLTNEAKAFAEALKPIILRSGTPAGNLNITPPEARRTM